MSDLKNDFGVALAFIKGTEKVKRKGWKERYLILRGETIYDESPAMGARPYAPTQEDILATDWELVV